MEGLSRGARALFSPKRFEIATVLLALGPMTMAELRRATGLTWGDLDSNLRYLEREGLVRTRKVVTRGGPRTLVSLTREGEEAYRELAGYLEERLRRAGQGATRGGGPGPGGGGA